MNAEHYWTACHTQPGAEWKAREGIEKAGFGTFLPAYAKRIEHKTRYYPLMPGYVMVAIDGTNQGSIGEIHRELIEGVDCLLGRVGDAEVERLMRVHVLGEYNVVQHRNLAGRFTSEKPRKRRRPRPRACSSIRAMRRKRKRARLLGDFTGATNQVAA